MRLPPPPPRSGRPVRLLPTMHAMMHYGAYGDRCAPREFGVSRRAALLPAVESKLLGSFMRLIPPGTRDRGVTPRGATAQTRLFCFAPFSCSSFTFLFRNQDHAGELSRRRAATQRWAISIRFSENLPLFQNSICVRFLYESILSDFF